MSGQATLYLGTNPSRTQDVNPALKELGIELIRSSPDDIKPVVMVTRQSPQYEIYRSYFPLYTKKAYAPNTFQSTSDSVFIGIPSQAVLPILPSFNVVFSFPSTLTETQLSNLMNVIPSRVQICCNHSECTYNRRMPVFELVGGLLRDNQGHPSCCTVPAGATWGSDELITRRAKPCHN